MMTRDIKKRSFFKEGPQEDSQSPSIKLWLEHLPPFDSFLKSLHYHRQVLSNFPSEFLSFFAPLHLPGEQEETWAQGFLLFIPSRSLYGLNF